MNRFLDILLFAIANITGFFSVGICYAVGMQMGIISHENPNFDAAQWQTILTTILLTWLICALFSIGFFFLKGWARYAFLLAPIVMPIGYGLFVLSSHAS